MKRCNECSKQYSQMNKNPEGGCTPSVVQINNDPGCVLFHKVVFPASIGDDTTNPPSEFIGKYKNVLLVYEANNHSYMFSSDGVPTFITGEKGDQGDQGDQGEQGETGPAGTIEIGETTTGEPGTDASVENVGTPENAILNFTIPQGEKGEQGYMNEQDVRDVVDTIIPENFFDNNATASDCGTSITLDNMLGGDTTSFSLKGETAQATNSGKNLFNPFLRYLPGTSTTSNDVTFTSENDGGLRLVGRATAQAVFYLSSNTSWSGTNVEIPLDPTKKYRFSLFRPDDTYRCCIRGIRNGSVTTIVSNADATVTNCSGITYAHIEVVNGATVNGTIKIQLEEGEVSSDYEPYTDGLSPNPDFPQAIKTVTGRNIVNVDNGQGDEHEYEINLGKNLFDKDHVNKLNASITSTDITLGAYNRVLYIPCLPNTTYTVQKRNDGDTNRFIVATTNVTPAGGVRVYNRIEDYNARTITITTSPLAKFLVVQYFRTYETVLTETQVLESIQIEIGAQATPYAVFFNPIELCKIDDHQDYIYKSGDKWYIHKEIGVSKIDVSAITLNTSYTNVDYAQFDKPTDFVGYDNYQNHFVYCSHATYQDGGDPSPWDSTERIDHIYTRAEKRLFWIGFTKGTSIDNIKAMLENCTVYYILTTPTDTLVTEPTVLAQLNNIHLESGTNTISLSSSGLLGELCIGGLLDNWNGNMTAVDKMADSMEKVRYVFPYASQTTSEFSLLYGYGKTLLIDCGLPKQRKVLVDTLAKNNVTHVDYMIISHFHTDHCGNLTWLYDAGYCDDNTVLVLPSFNAETWVNNSAYPNYVNIMAYIAEHDISYITPTEGYEITIAENFSLKIYNTNDTYYIDGGINSDYNNASLIVITSHYETHGLYTGDCYRVALRHVFDTNELPRTYGIYKMGHHGIDNVNNSIVNFIRDLNIENAVQIIGMSDLVEGKSARGGTYGDLRGITDNIFVVAYNRDNISFESTHNDVYLINGQKNGSDGVDVSYEDIYVDATAGVSVGQDGSAEHPFANIFQATGYAQRNNGRNYTIHVASGNYNQIVDWVEARPTLYGMANAIKIVGSGDDTVLNYGFTIIDCASVSISNLKIVNSIAGRGISILASNVTLENVIYDAEEGHRDKNAIFIENGSNVVMKNIEISHAQNGILADDSTISIVGATFSSVTPGLCIQGTRSVFPITSQITVSDSSLLYGGSDTNTFLGGLELYSGTSKYTDTNISLVARPVKFRTLDVEYTINGYARKDTFSMNGETITCSLQDIYVASDGKNYSAFETVKFYNSTTADYQYSRLSSQNRSDGTFTYQDGVDTFTITRIVGH